MYMFHLWKENIVSPATSAAASAYNPFWKIPTKCPPSFPLNIPNIGTLPFIYPNTKFKFSKIKHEHTEL